MPKYPNTVSWQEAEYVARITGFVLRNHAGTSHRQYKKEGAGVLTIPTYKEISVNKGHLFAAMLRQMGIGKSEFFSILNKK